MPILGLIVLVEGMGVWDWSSLILGLPCGQVHGDRGWQFCQNYRWGVNWQMLLEEW